MNSEAASETQYEDSKSQLSTYRKDDKIMLKRKLLSVLLALVLVVSMAVPALAASGSGTYNGSSYSYEATDQTTRIYGRFTYGISTSVSVHVNLTMWCSAHTDHVYKGNSGDGTRSAYCYVYKNTTTNEYYSHDCVVQSGTLTGKVGSVTAVYATF